jgi:hypothetical protein
MAKKMRDFLGRDKNLNLLRGYLGRDWLLPHQIIFLTGRIQELIDVLFAPKRDRVCLGIFSELTASKS